MKRLLAIALLVILSTGCSRSAPTPPPTEPAANFPTPAPESLPLCSPADLNTSANHSGEDGTIVLGVTLINKSKSYCALANPPAVSLLEAEKVPIDLHPQELTAEQIPPALVTLPPGESVILSLVWQNYCLTKLEGGLTLRLALAKDQNLDVKMDIPPAPKCASGQVSAALLVAPYSYPP